MDPEAPVTVLKGSLTACSAGALIGTTYGIVKRQPPIVPAINSSINCGLAGLSFFALREYVAGPVLVHMMPWQTYARRRERLCTEESKQLAYPSSDRVSLSELRSYKLLDTAIAGAGTGSVLNAWRRGPPGVLPGAVTAGLICTAVQFMWNELNVMRVRYVSQSNPTHLDRDALPVRGRTMSEKVMDGLSIVFPIKKISDEVYLQRLLREKEEVEKRLEVVRKELRDTERKDKSE